MTGFGRASRRLLGAGRVNLRNHWAEADVGDVLPGGKSDMACRADTPGKPLDHRLKPAKSRKSLRIVGAVNGWARGVPCFRVGQESGRTSR